MRRRTFLMTAAATVASGRLAAATIDGRTFHAPAEEAPHARTWMCWPSRSRIYGGRRQLETVQEHLASLVRAIAKYEPVTMAATAAHHALIRELCGPVIDLVDIETDDMWARDSGPVFLTDGADGVACLDFAFNGWGNKQVHENDRHVAAAIAAERGCPHIPAGIVGEGGGLEYDGEGTLLLTDSCWVNDNRNPDMTRSEIENALKAGLGVEKVIWLPGVRGRDITDGHIDGSIRIVRPGLLMTGGYPGDTSIWGQVLEESKAILKRETDARGRSFEMVDIPSAVNVRSRDPYIFTGYANYYVGNGAIYTPRFGDRTADGIANDRLGKLYPDREIVALDVDRIYESGGGIHCVTQQEPAV